MTKLTYHVTELRNFACGWKDLPDLPLLVQALHYSIRSFFVPQQLGTVPLLRNRRLLPDHGSVYMGTMLLDLAFLIVAFSSLSCAYGASAG